MMTPRWSWRLWRRRCRRSPAEAPPRRPQRPSPVVRPVYPAPPDVAAPPADAAKTASGLGLQGPHAGHGNDHPRARRRRQGPLHGLDTDGKMFDSSVARGQPAHVPAQPRHQGLDRGRAAHGRRREAPLLDPRGPRLQGPRRPRRRACWCSTSSCSASQASPTAAPADVAAPPEGREEDGVAASPTRCSRRAPARTTRRREQPVEVHYTGWTTDGKMFDSSVGARRARDVPAQRRHPGLDRGRAAHGRGREDPLLDPPELAYDGQQGSRRACSCSTSS